MKKYLRQRAGYALASCGLVLAIGISLLALAGRSWEATSGDGGDAGGGAPLVLTLDRSAAEPAPPGTPRQWQGALQVGTYSTVNLRSGNLLTAVPLVAWSGKGPPISMDLYHNSLTDLGTSGLDLTRGMGFDLGDGWSTSYSGQVILEPSTQGLATVIEDDGTRNVYTLSGSDWVPPTGVFDVLTRDQGTWRLTRKGQTYRDFDTDGLLEAVGDAAGNEITITRDAQNNDRITEIEDASGRNLVLSYNNTNGLLDEIEDPDDGDSQIADRVWEFTYNAQDRVERVRNTQGGVNYDVGLTYYTSGVKDGKLATISDFDGDKYGYDYSTAGLPSGRLTEVTDPEPAQLTQEFGWVLLGNQTTRYYDRRGHVWYFNFNADRELYRVRNPLSELTVFGFDDDHNRISLTDGEAYTWTADFDTNGNLTDSYAPYPLSFHQEWVYDEYNNLTSYTDALDNTIEYEYLEVGTTGLQDPTLPVKIIEPADGQSNGVAETDLTYYDAQSSGAWRGLLHTVTDANGVTTEYAYDGWGQPAGEKQGCASGSPPTVASPDTEFGFVFDSGGRFHGAEGAYYEGSLLYGDQTRSSCGRHACSSTCYYHLIRELPPTPELPDGWPRIPDCGASPPGTNAPDWEAEYTDMGQLTSLHVSVEGSLDRQFRWQYDEFGRATTQGIVSPLEWADGEWGGGQDVSRDYTFTYDDDDGTYTRTGPDDVTTTVTLDRAYRVFRSVMSNGLEVQYSYYKNGLPKYAVYGNGTQTHYEYDGARRLAKMTHEVTSTSQSFRVLEYDWYDNGLLAEIHEPNPATALRDGGPVIYETTQFYYDNRGRLIREHRAGIDNYFAYHVYDLLYTYDQVGNRLTKEDVYGYKDVEYVYDVSDTETYGSCSNRLMYYTIDDEHDTDDEEVWYTYDYNGNVTRVIRRYADEDQYRSTWLVYDSGARVQYVIGETVERGRLGLADWRRGGIRVRTHQ